MAECRRFVCGRCARAVDAWSDGNPYYVDEGGQKRYAYHPDHENLARCVGNDVPHLCLACGATTKVDSRAPRDQCRRCRARQLVATWDLAGRRCPYCKEGAFGEDPRVVAIS
jgi:hypothetical protein